MKNIDTLKKLTLGKEDITEVIIEFEDEKYPLNMRPLTSGELTKLQAIEKKPLIFKVEMQNGKRTGIQSNDVDINTGEFAEAQSEAMYNAIALSLSVDGETIKPDDVKGMKAGLPEIIFEKVIEISNLSSEDLTMIKSFQ